MIKILSYLGHLALALALTATTQIGGLLYLLCLYWSSKFKLNRIKFIGLFTAVYLLFCLLIIPIVAPIFGRERVLKHPAISPRNGLYSLLNRNYVTPELNQVLQNVASRLSNTYPELTLVYLDAGFPFVNGFPLLPHLSHNDGKKIDLSFVYADSLGQLTNKKPSLSGYGVFHGPTTGELNQTEICKNEGKWQYDYARYISFGNWNKDLVFNQQANKYLIQQFAAQPAVSKIFIEPHLKHRLKLKEEKIRFHGCQAVRHDDHIHVQIQ